MQKILKIWTKPYIQNWNACHVVTDIKILFLFPSYKKQISGKLKERKRKNYLEGKKIQEKKYINIRKKETSSDLTFQNLGENIWRN